MSVNRMTPDSLKHLLGLLSNDERVRKNFQTAVETIKHEMQEVSLAYMGDAVRLAVQRDMVTRLVITPEMVKGFARVRADVEQTVRGLVAIAQREREAQGRFIIKTDSIN